MVSRNHFVCVLRYHSWTTSCAVSMLVPVQHIFGCRCCLSINCRQPTLNIWPFNALFPQELRVPSLPMIIALHFVAIDDVLRPLDLVMTQKLFTHDKSFVMECRTKTTLSDHNSHDITNFYLLKKICFFYVQWIRSLGRPKNRWEDDVKSDITNMRITN